jgi:hypothetical protein
MMDEVYEWLQKIMDAHPPFDPATFVPLTVKYPDKSVKELWALVSTNGG